MAATTAVAAKTLPVRCDASCPFTRHFAVATCTVCNIAVCGGCQIVHAKMHSKDSQVRQPTFLGIIPTCSHCNTRVAHFWNTGNNVALCPACTVGAGPQTRQDLVPYFLDAVIAPVTQFDLFAKFHCVNTPPAPTPPTTPSLLDPALALAPVPSEVSVAIGVLATSEEKEEKEEKRIQVAFPCRHWNRGFCKRVADGSCYWAHVCSNCQSSDHGAKKCPGLISAPPVTKAVPTTTNDNNNHNTDKRCNRKFFCQSGLKCENIHTAAEKNAFRRHPDGKGRQAYKTDYCRARDKCNNKSACTWAHDDTEAICILCHETGHIGRKCRFA